MMNKLKKIAVITFVTLVFASCKDNDGFLDTLQKEVHYNCKLASENDQGFSTFKLSKITKFKWDRFYVFDEYVTEKNINSISGITWDGPDVPSGHKRLFFIYKGGEVNYFDFDPKIFPLFLFTCESTEQYEFILKDDVFATFESCDKNGCILAMVPKRCIGNFKRLYKK
ncbi:MAG: hypothetical protein EOO42_07090 [Flavobacteriales bacterium]|nr:MAG: hypothetical protein EOO42_07090 [Flavobacteriales bacterium]